MPGKKGTHELVHGESFICCSNQIELDGVYGEKIVLGSDGLHFQGIGVPPCRVMLQIGESYAVFH